jgi:hypothetical protein
MTDDDRHPQRAARRRRITTGLTAATGVVVLIVSGCAQSHSTTAASATGYVGSRWRLTSVADGSTTTIGADVGAWMDLLPTGEILVEDGVNAHDGRFTVNGDILTIGGASSTFAMYGGDDPARLAAIAAVNTLAYGNPAGTTPDGPVTDTVVSVDAGQLVLQAGSMRLTFSRSGPAHAGATAQPT